METTIKAGQIYKGSFDWGTGTYTIKELHRFTIVFDCLYSLALGKGEYTGADLGNTARIDDFEKMIKSGNMVLVNGQ